MPSYTKTLYETLGRDPVHPFPARMAPGIAIAAMTAAEQPMCVLDPMSGSGTVLALARAQGHHAIGIDIDPLAVLISRVWTTPIEREEAQEQGLRVLERARARFKKVSIGEAYPLHADEETKKFVRYWFDGYVRRQLVALSDAIAEVSNTRIRDVLWCALSRLIITKQSGVSLAMDLSHSRPHKAFLTAPEKPFNKFISALRRVTKNCIATNCAEQGPEARVIQGDARSLPVDDDIVDLVLTSPPYLNAIDYFRCSKFSLVWMGYTIRQLRKLRAESVGAERGLSSDDAEVDLVVRELRLQPRLSSRHEAILRRYIVDMRASVREVARVLKKGGVALYVVGENTIKGTFVPNAAVVTAAAEAAGLQLRSRHSRELPANRRYLPPPRNRSVDAGLDSRMRREIVLTFERCTA